LKGKLFLLSEIEQHPLAQGVIGDGIAILPYEGRLIAPFDGRIIKLFSNHHTLILENQFKEKLLIHLGVNSKKVLQKDFCIHFGQNATISEGQTLITFDLVALKKQGVDLRCMIIVIENDLHNILQSTKSEVNYLQPILMLEERGKKEWQTHLSRELKEF
jgi:glucose-specific phosphotransferase system IIA component